jgi:hypothetical protein
VIAMAKQSVTLEVLSYHASASLEDAQRLRVSCVQVISKNLVVEIRINCGKRFNLLSLTSLLK